MLPLDLVFEYYSTAPGSWGLLSMNWEGKARLQRKRKAIHFALTDREQRQLRAWLRLTEEGVVHSRDSHLRVLRFRLEPSPSKPIKEGEPVVSDNTRELFAFAEQEFANRPLPRATPRMHRILRKFDSFISRRFNPARPKREQTEELPGVGGSASDWPSATLVLALVALVLLLAAGGLQRVVIR